MGVQPYSIDIPQATLDDLQDRLAHTRWASEVEGAGWDYGTNLGYLKSLNDYWKNCYDWRAQEAKLNQFSQYRATVGGLGVHFIHERGKGPNPLPLILTHGWPDSFYRMYKIIPMLADPVHFGGDPADSFDVIVPSLPGYGFSDAARERGMTLLRTADMWSKLMTEVLGYKRYAAGGGDFGSQVTRLLAIAHPDQLVGIHLTDFGYPGDAAFSTDLSNLSEAEQKYLGFSQGWFFREGAYAAIQSTKPQTIA
jgi:pimeloyl-ACP methyl ester carboxylesterase